MRTYRFSVVAIVCGGLMVASAVAQSTAPPASAPAEHVAAPASVHATKDDAPDTRPVRDRLGDLFVQVDLDHVSAQQALTWWQSTTGITVLVNWNSLEAQGINPRQAVTLQLKKVPVGKVLSLIMDAMSSPQDPQATLIYEMTPFSIEIITKATANRRLVTRVYDVAPALLAAPDWGTSRANTTSLGGGGRTVGTLFNIETTGGTDQDRAAAHLAAGEKLAEQVRQGVEPALWREHGGTVASLHYLRDQFVVTAPRYVHEQVAEYLSAVTGIPYEGVYRGGSGGGSDSSPTSDDHPSGAPSGGSGGASTGVSSVQPRPGPPVSGVQGR